MWRRRHAIRHRAEVNTPDAGRPMGAGMRQSDPAIRRRRRTFFRLLLVGTTLMIAYLALMPNSGHTRFWIVPLPVYRWLAAPEHDGIVNVFAFGFFAAVVFLVERDPDASGTSLLSAIFATRLARLVGLLALVCVIETVQIWIPGRTSSLDDVCTGWSGIFAAWLLWVLLNARAKSGGM